LWILLESQLRTWEGLLDSRLGGALGAAGAWLARAEKIIHTDDIPSQMNEGTAAVISRKLEEHKLFFADLPTVLEKFEAARTSPAARDVPPAQLQSLTARFATIGTRAAQRRVRLKFLEHKVTSGENVFGVRPQHFQNLSIKMLSYFTVLPHCVFASD